MKIAIPYYRVSTDKQGVSGLGLIAQRNSIRAFAKHQGFKLIGEYTEVESGKKNNRPVLSSALSECKRKNAVLLIAKLDRLGRNMAFISKLMESDVEFVAVDNPYANKLIVHIMAAFAEYERDQISTRTKAALKVAKAKGTELGRFGKKILSKRNKQRSEDFAKKMMPIIEKLKRQDFTTVREITAELNKRQIPTFRKGRHKWHVATVHGIMKRHNHLA